MDDHGLEFLLAFDGRIHRLDKRYWIKFRIRRVAVSRRRPHGLSYSLTLHDPDGKRLVGFDNAHPAKGSSSLSGANDHWHRAENESSRPYGFVDGDGLLADFFREVRRVLADRDVAETVIAVDEERR